MHLRTAILIIGLIWTSYECQSQYDSLQFDGRTRTYLVHLPTAYAGNENLSLVLAMHGGFGSAQNLENQSQFSIKADAENFIVVYPEGVKSPLSIRTWNAGWCCGYSSNNNIDDVGFINALIDTLIDKYAIDTDRIYATGMSNGGFMSYRLACELSHRIAAIGPVSCSQSTYSCSSSRAVPIIHVHSYPDSHVPHDGGIGSGPSNHYNRQLDSIMEEWSTRNNCKSIDDTIVNNSEYTFRKWSDCDCEAEVHYYASQDGGHSWPGGNRTTIGDTVSTYVNATDLIWDFFKKHSLDCAVASSSIQETNDIISINPNPAKNKLMFTGIEKQNIGDLKVVIYNPISLKVQESRIDKDFKINLDLPRGIYIMKIEDSKSNLRKVQKLVIE